MRRGLKVRLRDLALPLAAVAFFFLATFAMAWLGRESGEHQDDPQDGPAGQRGQTPRVLERKNGEEIWRSR